MRVALARAARSMRQTAASKQFFFAKKNQKTLVYKALALPRRVRQMDKSFWLLFSKRSALVLSMRHPHGNLVLLFKLRHYQSFLALFYKKELLASLHQRRRPQPRVRQTPSTTTASITHDNRVASLTIACRHR
jgi:hypothetical protein